MCQILLVFLLKLRVVSQGFQNRYYSSKDFTYSLGEYGLYTPPFTLDILRLDNLVHLH